MKKTHIILATSILTMLYFSSCRKDFLDVEPVDAISASSGFSEPEKVNAFITGIYDKLQYYYYSGHILMYADVRGEDVYVKSSGNYGRFPNEYQYAVISTNFLPAEFWSTAYSVIANCNQVISRLPKEQYDEGFKNAVIAEARALRATAHFNLVLLFAQPYSVSPDGLGVPLVLEPILPSDEPPARNKVGEVYDAIIDDLLFAEQHLPNDRSNVLVLTTDAIRGLLARVYLHKGDWENAAKYAELVYPNHTLASESDLLNGFVDVNSEWIWGLDMREDDNNGYLMLPSFYDTRTLGYSSFRADKAFVALYESSDIRNSWYGSESEGGYRINKYLHRPEWDMDQVLMRSAEMYLIAAEAHAELGNKEKALTALHRVQNRSQATPTDNSVTIDQLKAAIQIERRKELVGEGFRIFDITRRKEPLVRVSSSHWAKINLPANSPRFLCPIPKSEMEANPNMVQNAGY